jgi:hypothetical protein
MSGGPSLPANPTPAYQYPNMGTAASGALTGTQQLPNYAQQNYPQFQSATNNITSGAYGAPQIQGAGNTAISSGNSLVPYATQALQTGFDPQNAQYNAQFGQQQQQTGANAAANGVAGTPYGAGVTNAADNEFNLAWQQQELQRQQTGASTANSLLNQQNQGATTGSNLLTGAANENLTGLTALNNAGSAATGVDQQMIQDFLAYLSGGTSASNAATNQYSAESSAALGQQGLNMQGLSGLGSLAGMFLDF